MAFLIKRKETTRKGKASFGSPSLVIACLLALSSISKDVLSARLPDHLSIVSSSARDALVLIESGRVSRNADSAVTVLVFFAEEPVAPEKSSNPRQLRLDDRRRATLSRLQSYESPDENRALREISSLPGATVQRRYWITRAALVTLPLSQLIPLTKIENVQRVVENVALAFDAPVSEELAEAGQIGGASCEVRSMNAPALWAQGITGAGSVVVNFDTGVDGDHPALKDRYHGNVIGQTSGFFAPASPDSLPFDEIGHGTHTMGIMLGHTNVDTFGVAPGASWIGAAVVDQGATLNGTIADILAAFEWKLNPDGDTTTSNDVPDVILNSWGIPIGLFGPCDNTFWQAIDNVEEAGIVTVFAAGNEGPAPFTLRSPANRISAPLNAFSVGAINQNNLTIADFSSRGPSTCDSLTTKPEVVAPGISVYSSDKDGSYALRSGTSMSAPFVAGLVALLREYNPDATVMQIKQAIIASCADLGAPGPDNSYGHGLPDAVRALSFMPAPVMPKVTITQIRVLSGSFNPGQSVKFSFSAQAPIGAYDSLQAVITAPTEPGLTFTSNRSVFYFSPTTGSAVNLQPFELVIDNTVPHGQEITLRLKLSRPSGDFVTAEFTQVIGAPPAGTTALIDQGRLELTVSDFAQFGLAQGSAYNVGARGLRFNNSANLLYEAGIVVGRNSLQVSSSIRDVNGESFYSDFVPLDTLTLTTAADGGIRADASYHDGRSAVSIPIEVSQIVSVPFAEDDFVIIEFVLRNTSIEPVTNLYFGFFNDLDLSSGGTTDQAGYDPGLNMMYQSSGQLAVGLLGLSEQDRGFIRINQPGKTPLSQTEKFINLQIDSLETGQTTPGDWYWQFSSGPFSLQPGDTQTLAFALALGSNLAELADAASRARAAYLLPTDVDSDFPPDQSLLPDGFALAQNYPNPFNPETIIEFSLSEAAQARLIVYNTLGQAVRTLYDSPAPAGLTRLRWDGRSDNGASVSSGVYFYRLETATSALTRKMTLLR